jgi:hypothetical protein
MLGKDKKKREFALCFLRARRFRFFSRFFYSFALASAKARKKRECPALLGN